jgi:hypothetical protein
MQTVDVRNKDNPILRSLFADPTWASCHGVTAEPLLLSSDEGLSLFDTSDLNNPIRISHETVSPWQGRAVLKIDNSIYWICILNDEYIGLIANLAIYQINDSTLQSMTWSSIQQPGYNQTLGVWSNYALTASDDFNSAPGICVVHMSGPLDLGNYGDGQISQIAITSNYLVSAEFSGLKIHELKQSSEMYGGTYPLVDITPVYQSEGSWGGSAVRVSGQRIALAIFGGVEVYQFLGLKDTDQDDLPDDWELQRFGNLTQGPNDDPDADGIKNWGECQAGTNPMLDDDADADGLSDADEILLYNSNPHNTDSDGDGIDDAEEVIPGVDGVVTRADKEDTDEDGVDDGIELDIGRNPVDESDGGLPSSISGFIRSSGVGLEGAYVEFRGASGMVYHRQLTDASGAYSIGAIEAGHYFVKVGAERFADKWHENAIHRASAVPYSVPVNSTINGFDFDLVPGQSPALVEVTSDPAGAMVYLDYQLTTNLTPTVLNVGEIGLIDGASNHLAPHTLVLKKTGCPRPSPQSVIAVEAETVTVHFDMTSSATTGVYVTSSPEGADVFVDYADTSDGITPVMVNQLAPGSHVILLRKDHHLQPRPVIAHLAENTPNEISVPLTTNTSGDRVVADLQSIPPRASVYVDYLPTTNVTDVIIAWMDPASHAGSGWHSASHALLLRSNGYLPAAPRYLAESTNRIQNMLVHLMASSETVLDANSNGLPDAWEAAYQLQTLAPSECSADKDADHDGVNNRDEMLAGTDPLDGDSRFSCTDEMDLENQGQSFTFVFDSIPGRMYIVQGCDNLKASWTNLSGVITAEDYQTSITINVAEGTPLTIVRVIILTP